MNGFALHNIKHVSPSSLNTWAAAPALWAAERLLGKRGVMGCAAHRGTASETGIIAGCLDPEMSLADCQAKALIQYDNLTALSGDPKRAKEREAIPGYVEQGLIALRPYGIPDEIQMKVLHDLPGLPVPMLGFLDIGWSHLGIRIDIKTTGILHSDIVEAHSRQVSTYLHGTNYEGRVAYITPKKHGVYVLENATEHLAALVNIGQRLNRFLSLSSDPEELVALLTPDYSAFYWNSSATRAMGREVYGF